MAIKNIQLDFLISLPNVIGNEPVQSKNNNVETDRQITAETSAQSQDLCAHSHHVPLMSVTLRYKLTLLSLHVSFSEIGPMICILVVAETVYQNLLKF